GGQYSRWPDPWRPEDDWTLPQGRPREPDVMARPAAARRRSWIGCAKRSPNICPVPTMEGAERQGIRRNNLAHKLKRHWHSSRRPSMLILRSRPSSQLMINRADGGAGESSPPACADRPELMAERHSRLSIAGPRSRNSAFQEVRTA